MFATLPKSYDENQFLAHIVTSLQACHLDPSEFQNLLFLFLFFKIIRRCGIGNRIHYPVPSGFFDYIPPHVNFPSKILLANSLKGTVSFGRRTKISESIETRFKSSILKVSRKIEQRFWCPRDTLQKRLE
jgi:hypothetical protein